MQGDASHWNRAFLRRDALGGGSRNVRPFLRSFGGTYPSHQKIAVMPRVAITWAKTAATQKNILIEEIKSTKKPNAKQPAPSQRQTGLAEFFSAITHRRDHRVRWQRPKASPGYQFRAALTAARMPALTQRESPVPFWR
jgi:hypothetical protein